MIRAAAPMDEGHPHELRGPGKLCRGLGVTLAHKGLDLTAGGPMFVVDDGSRPPKRARSPRIGVDYAGAWAARPLRFFVAGHPSVSGPRMAGPLTLTLSRGRERAFAIRDPAATPNP